MRSSVSPGPWSKLGRLTLGHALALGLVAALFVNAAARAQDLDPEQLGKNREALDRNGFKTDRGYHDYTRMLPGLAEDVPTWTSDMRVLDAGAGEGGFLIDLLTFDSWRAAHDAYWGVKSAPPASMPELVGAGWKRPKSAKLDAALESFKNRLSYVEGELGTQDLAVETTLGLGTFDRILCLYGASSYTEHYDTMIRGFGSLLRTGGQMRLLLAERSTRFEDSQGRRISTIAYLSTVKGLRVVSSQRLGTAEDTIEIVVERTGAPLEVPSLVPVDFRAGTPPTRLFREALAATPPRATDRSLGAVLLDRLGDTIDLEKETDLAAKLVSAGVDDFTGSKLFVDTALLTRAIHGDWAALVNDVEVQVGDVVPLLSLKTTMEYTGRVVAALEGGRFRVAPILMDDGVVEVSRPAIAESIVAEKVLLHETALDVLHDPEATKNGQPVTVWERVNRIAATLAGRGIPDPKGQANLTGWTVREAAAAHAQSYVARVQAEATAPAPAPDPALARAIHERDALAHQAPEAGMTQRLGEELRDHSRGEVEHAR